jgi:hypothetical protein
MDTILKPVFVHLVEQVNFAIPFGEKDVGHSADNGFLTLIIQGNPLGNQQLKLPSHV